MKTVLSVLLLSPLLAAQAPEPDKKLSTIEGTVVSSVGGKPLANVEIGVDPHFTVEGSNQQGSNRYTATTDKEGKFVVDAVRPGMYNVRAMKAGFTTKMWGSKGKTLLGATLTVTAGVAAKDVSFSLVRQGVLVGKIVDENDEPMMGVRLMLFHYGYNMPNGAIVGGRSIIPYKGAFAGVLTDVSNDIGEFRLPNLPPNTYFLLALAPNRQPSPPRTPPDPEKGIERYAATFYPGVADLHAATGIPVEPGYETRAPELRLRKVRVYKVSGSVIAEGGLPPGEAVVMMSSDSGSGSAARLAPGGGFTFQDVQPGTYNLRLYFPDRAQGNSLPVAQTVTVGKGDINDLLLRLPTPMELTGAVSIAAPTSGAAVSEPPKSLAGIRLSLTTPDELNTVATVTESDGKFLFKNALPGKYRIYVRSLPQGVYVKSILAGGLPAQRNMVDLAPGTELKLILGSDGAQLETQVLDDKGNPVAGATVSMFPAGEEVDLSGQRHWGVNSDQSGRVRYAGIPPGDYKILAYEDHEPGAPQDPEFRKPFESRVVRVRLEENGRENKLLKLITADEIAAATGRR